MSQVLDWMSALGDMTRVRLLALCDGHELSVAELCAILQLPQSTTSRHLKVLSDDGWLLSRRDGTSRFYRVAQTQLAPGARKLWKLIAQQGGDDLALREDEQRLQGILLERQSRSQAFFASSVGEWDRLRGELFGAGFDAASCVALLSPHAVVADLGCGTGQSAARLAPFAGEVHAVDASAAMIRAAKQRLRGVDGVTVHKATLEDLPFEDGQLDVAFVTLVLHHVADPQVAIREVARTLKPGGSVIVVDMQKHEREEYRQQMGHIWLGFDHDEMRRWFEQSDLTPIHMVDLPPDSHAKGPGLCLARAQK